jgi:hypothetical protein
VIGATALLAAFTLPAVAWGHGGGVYSATVASTPPTIDGVLTDAAWANAPSYPVLFDGTIQASVKFVHTATDLYVGATVQDPNFGVQPSFDVFFDNNHSGVIAVGDDAWLAHLNPQLPAEDFYYDTVNSQGTSAPGFYNDLNAEGASNDTTAAATSVLGSSVTFEIKHPLCSLDSAHDICIQPGEWAGVDFQYQPDGILSYNAPGVDTSSPSNNWADLGIGPALRWTNPADGNTVLSGTVNATVDATSDTGHVVFEYFDGLTEQTTTLGTDTSAPFSVPFNTTQFPDRQSNASTLYATPYDAAGNAGQRVGVGIGLSNGIGTVHGALDTGHIYLVGMLPNTSVAITVDDQVHDQFLFNTGPTDSNGNLDIQPSGWSLAPGTVITANDGRGLKTLTLVGIHITGVDTTANTVSGTAPANSPVRAVLFFNGNQVSLDNGTADANGNFTIHFTKSRVTTGSHVIADTPDSDGDRSRADFAVTNETDQFAISITGDPAAQAGVGSVALTGPNALPINALTGTAGGPPGTGLGGIGLGGIGLGGIGLGGIGLGGIKLEDIGLGGIGLGGIGLGGIGLGGIGLTALNLNQNGLGGVPLSTIPLKLNPLKPPDSWQVRLDANPAFKGTPVQSVTLGQVLGTSVVQGVALKDLDISGSALGGIGLGGIGLGGIGLGGIGLGGIADGVGGYYGGSSTATALQGWCDYINRQPGYSCTDPTTLTAKTVMDIALQGVGLGGIPFEKIGLGGINLTGTGLGGIPIGTALGGIGLGGIDLTGTALGGIGLGGIDMHANALGGIALGGIPTLSSIVDCTGAFVCSPTATLKDAADAGAIKPTAKVQDIRYFCVAGAPTASWCRATDTPILLQDFIKGLPSTVTLADLLGSLLPQAAYDWEQLPLLQVPLQDYSSDGGVVTYTATYSVTGSSDGTRAADIQVTLPDGARYVAGSTVSSAALTMPEPDFNATQNTLTWHATFPGSTQETLVFKAKPGIQLGTVSAGAKVLLSGEVPTTVATAPTPASTSLTQTFAGDGSPATATTVAPDTLYLGYTPNGSDRDYFSLPLPAAGTQVTVHLGHLKVDDDLVVFAPTVDPLRVPKPGTAATVAPNVSPNLQQRTQAIQPEVLGDVPQTPPSGQSVVGVSDNRGLADEQVTFIVPEHAPDAVATLQVTSYAGGYSNDPWTLRVEQSPAIPLPPTCASPTLVGGGVTKALPASVGGSTLYLFNSKRFGDLYGLAAENSVWTKLATLAGRSDAAGGSVIPVDAVSSIASTLTPWYANGCSPGASNAVVRTIGRYLDTIPSTYKYVVLVGDYDVLPPGLVLDNTSYVNEREYASTFLGATNNQYLSAYALGYLPTDDPYGDTNYSGTGAYIPEAAVGRLVETPAQISSQLDRYVTLNGAINPTTALVTGYDFLSDGALQVAASLQPKVPAPAQLIGDTWTKTNLLAALFPGTNGPQIDVVNAHYDHRRSLPADQNAAQRDTILYTTGDVGTNAMANRLVITLGCHSGLSVSDLLVGTPLATDWAQTYAAQGAIDYIGNTGFGLGETAGVAYSEQLQVLLAQRLDGSMTVGQALTYAKQEYAGSVPTTSGYQLKVLDEAEMYGLPMYQVGSGTSPAGPTPQPVTTDPTTGLASTSFNLSPTYTPASASTGNYYTVGGSAAYENRRPIEPLSKLDVTEPNLVAHGALLTGLTSTDQASFDAAFSRVVDDSSALSPELVGDVTYPSKLQSVTTFATPNGTRQRLLLFGGQYKSDGTPDASGIGTQRLFGTLSGTVLYAAPIATDFESPTFGPVAATSPSPSTVGFAVDVTDNNGADAVKRVVALYRDASGNWRSIDLSRAGITTRWSGAGLFAGTAVEWYIQAADATGNVGVTSNKADVKSTTPPASTGSIAATLNGPQANGWYTGDVGATLTGAPGITYSLDGAPFAPGATLTVSGTGVHTLAFQGSDGSQGSVVVPIDVTPPTISIQSGIISTGTRPQVVCADAGSGIASCVTTPSTLDISVGTHSVHVVATDRVGNVTQKDGSYTIDSFTGFFAPVDNPSIVNVAKAGSAVPVKFSLGLNLGLGIVQPGYPIVQLISCDSSAPQDVIDQTLTANASGLQYDAGSNQYTYVWKTTSAWSGSCRQLIVRLTDGTEHRANFKFK